MIELVPKRQMVNSLDLAPITFMFPKMKSVLRGTYFPFVKEVKSKMADLLRRVSANDLRHCFWQWRIHMQQCIDEGVD